jgi:hypothetical protein
VDFLDWKCLNLPCIRPFQLTNVFVLQPIVLSLYELLPSGYLQWMVLLNLRPIPEIWLPVPVLRHNHNNKHHREITIVAIPY